MIKRFKYFGNTISKWEKSFFGGYDRLIIDYPRVDIDNSVDFDFAPIKELSYYEKDKLLKIFLSKTNSYGLIDNLLQNAKSVSETSFMGDGMIKTIIDKSSKEYVINSLMRCEREYNPLFKHYKKFILESDIFFLDTDDNKQNESGKTNKKAGSKNKKISEEKISICVKSDSIRKFEKALKKIKEEEYRFDSISTFKTKPIIEVQEPDKLETKYNRGERDVADRLTKLLDISFDPTSDTVKNLRLGKLDITKIAEVPAGNIAIYKQNIENQTTKPFSVVILCDESGSMEGDRLESQYHIVKSLYRSFSDMLPQDKIFVYGHSGGNIPELYIYHDLYNQNFLTTIDRMLGRYCQQNYDGPIIENIYKNVRAATGDRIIFIVLSDGMPCGDGYGGEKDCEDMKKIIERCKRDDFVTIGVGIENHEVEGLYQYTTIVDDLNDMPKKISHIVNHVVKTEFQ